VLAGHRSQQARFALDLVERDGIVASPAGITRSRAASASSTRRGRVFMAWMIFIHAVNWQSHVAKAHPVRLPAIRVAHRCAKRRGRRAPARFMDNWPPALLHHARDHRGSGAKGRQENPPVRQAAFCSTFSASPQGRHGCQQNRYSHSAYRARDRGGVTARQPSWSTVPSSAG
jgi:hypothetical protein